MPYDPYALSEDQKSRSYNMVWVGLPISLALVACNFLSLGPVGAILEGAGPVIIGCHLVTFATYNRFDEHFRSLASFGFACGIVVIALWFLAQGLLGIFYGAYGLGHSAAGSPVDPGDIRFRLPDWFNRAFLLASLTATAFYGGFAYAWLRGRG